MKIDCSSEYNIKMFHKLMKCKILMILRYYIFIIFHICKIKVIYNLLTPAMKLYVVHRV